MSLQTLLCLASMRDSVSLSSSTHHVPPVQRRRSPSEFCDQGSLNSTCVITSTKMITDFPAYCPSSGSVCTVRFRTNLTLAGNGSIGYRLPCGKCILRLQGTGPISILMMKNASFITGANVEIEARAVRMSGTSKINATSVSQTADRSS